MQKYNALNALTIQAHNMLDRLAGDANALGLAVSGGSDSLALMYLASDWAKTRSIRLGVACVDHGLRESAANEIAHVAQHAKSLGLSFTGLSRQAEQSSVPVSQARLRHDRHALLNQWAKAQNLPLLAFGHTANDRLETLLMRARNSSDPWVLAAPLPYAASPLWPQGRGLKLIRPLSGITRLSLQDWLCQRNIPYCQDPSNQDRRFERVRMRQKLAAISAPAQRAGLACADTFLQMRREIMAFLYAHLTQNVCWYTDGSAQIEADCWNGLPALMQARLLQILAVSVSGCNTPARLQDCRALIENLSLRTPVTLGGAWIIKHASGIGLACAPQGQGRTHGARQTQSLLCRHAGHVLWDGRFELDLSAGSLPARIVCQDRAGSQTVSRFGFAAPDIVGHTPRIMPEIPTSKLAQMAKRSAPVLMDQRTPIACTAQALHIERALGLVADPRGL